MNRYLGPYQLGEAVGAGTFATVHRAFDGRLDDVVAIKVLAENHSLSPEIRERFIAEGRALRRVGGAHCAAVHDIGESERQQPYLVLEYADRGTLRQRVETLRRRGWRPSGDDLWLFAKSLSDGVHDVHAAQLVHRDLSPGNLLLTSRRPVPAGRTGRPSDLIGADETLLLADLGMCKDLALNSGLTVAGGTSGFRPPEQDKPGVVGIRADIWAMSALLGWLADGAAVPSAMAKRLAAVVRRGTSQSPDDRQADARQWFREVDDALTPPRPVRPVAAATPGTASSQPTPPPAVPAPRAKSRVRRWATVVALVVALVAGLWGGLRLAGGSPPSESGDASIQVVGPGEITVGESVTFSADVTGLDSWVWTLPTGRNVVDEAEVVVRATSTGQGKVVLRARAPDGTDLEVTHTLRVTEK